MLPPPPSIAGSEILIIDDTMPNIQLLATMLRNQGYIVHEAQDGPQALEAAHNLPLDMILLDVRMPGMDGYEVCRRLKADERTQPIPVIFVSALDDQTDKLQGFAAGGVDYITKPFQMKEVLARVQTHLTLRHLQHQLSQQNAQLQQEITHRGRIESALQEANEALEQRVTERTEALLNAIRDLNKELQERKRIEHEREQLLVQVRSHEQQIREMMNTVPEGVLLLDSSGQVLQSNPAAQQLLLVLAPYAQGRLAGLGEFDLPSLFAAPVQGRWHEITVVGRIFEAIARPLVEEAPTQAIAHNWVMLIREVTQDRENQRHLQQQDRLAAVGQMAAGIAHDFNNILAVILLYTEMALSTPDNPPRLRERLTIIAQQARRASELIQQILDFSRRSVLERRPMNLLPFFKEQVKILERTLPENIRIVLDQGGDELMVEADPTRMQQAILNLAVNARDAMPEGGRLLIRLQRSKPEHKIGCISCGPVTSGDWACIQVSDTGAGITPSHLTHIFEPFFTTKEPGKGTGLGLAQVYGIAKSHHGHIDVISTPGQGSTFLIYLPATTQPRRVVPQTGPLELARGAGEMILVVEDEDAIRRAMVDTLALINYRAIATANGAQALDYIRMHPDEIDLIISDVVMPEIGGIVLLRRIRQMGLKMPFILMTGHPLQQEEDVRDLELSAWLMKPPRIKQLATLIADTLKS